MKTDTGYYENHYQSFGKYLEIKAQYAFNRVLGFFVMALQK